MLHGIRDVNFFPVDAHLRKRAIQQLSCWSDERPTFAIFRIAGLLADEDDFGIARAFAKDCLRGVFVERTRNSGRGSVAQRVDVVGIGQLCEMPVCFGRMLGLAAGDHLFNSGGSFADQRRDKGRFGKILPMPLRHLSLHRMYFHARGIKNVRVVRTPHRRARSSALSRFPSAPLSIAQFAFESPSSTLGCARCFSPARVVTGPIRSAVQR